MNLKLLLGLSLLMSVSSVDALALQKAPSQKNLRVNALMTYDNDKDVNTFGLYSYGVTSPVTRTALKTIRALSASGGAVIANGKIYTYDYSVSYGYVNSSNYRTYDATTGEQLASRSVGYNVAPVYFEAATAVAQDPVSKVVYGSSISYGTASGSSYKYFLSTWDLEGMKKDSIAPLSEPMRVMAADSKGQLYGITMKGLDGTGDGGQFVKINKTTGELTVVGSTGIAANNYFQSAVIDPTTDTFYWFAVDDSQNANLYTVNLATGEPTLVGALPKGDQVQGACIAEAAAVDGAPSAVENLSLNFLGDALTGSVQFTMPTETYDGKTLSGELNYKVTDNGTVVAEGKAVAGSAVDAAVTSQAPGMHTFAVIVTNSVGDSPATDSTLYVGPDAPLCPTVPSAAKGSDGIKVTWTAPSQGKHGKGLDAANLTYNVMRLPDSTMVAENTSATEVTDHFTSDVLVSVSYQITPFNSTVQGDSAVTNKLTVGESVALPYTETFPDASALDLYTIIDANGDKRTWGYYNNTVRYSSSYTKAADEWLILPPVKMEKGKLYEMSYKVTGPSVARYTHKMALMMGNDAVAAAQTTTLKDVATYAGKTETDELVTITPAEDGVYYIGFHLTSDAGQSTLAVSNIKISAPLSADRPDVVTDLKAIAGEKGALKATIQFTAPSKNIAGEDLTELTGFILQRNGVEVDTMEVNSTAVKQYSFTDAVDKAGECVYTVVAYNANGKSAAVSDTIYVGVDIPVAPVTFTVVDNGDGTAAASWEAVGNTGANGGYVNVDDVTYTIFDSNNAVLAENVSGTEAVLNGLNNVAPQKEETFSVVAANAAGVSAKTTIDPIVVGPALALPFKESFDSLKYQNEKWTTTSVVGGSYYKFNLRADADQDGTGAGADYYGYTDGAQSRIATPKLDLTTTDSPYITYWVKAPTSATMDLQVSVDNGEWQTIKTFAENEAQEWTRDSVDLSSYKSKNVRIAFLATIVKGYNFVYIDNIEIDGGMASGITDVEFDALSEDENSGIYNLAGQRVGKNYKGIVIKNGQKMIVR